MTQGFLLGLGIFGGLFVASLMLIGVRLIASNFVEIAKVVGIFAGIGVVSYLGFAGCAVVLAAIAFLVLVGWLAAKLTTAMQRRVAAR